jgi:hypothetical protein
VRTTTAALAITAALVLAGCSTTVEVDGEQAQQRVVDVEAALTVELHWNALDRRAERNRANPYECECTVRYERNTETTVKIHVLLARRLRCCRQPPDTWTHPPARPSARSNHPLRRGRRDHRERHAVRTLLAALGHTCLRRIDAAIDEVLDPYSGSPSAAPPPAAPPPGAPPPGAASACATSPQPAGPSPRARFVRVAAVSAGDVSSTGRTTSTTARPAAWEAAARPLPTAAPGSSFCVVRATRKLEQP